MCPHKFKPNEKPPIISVIVPVFGSEKTLPTCLQSIQCQSHPDFEVILVDDGSSTDVAGIVSLAVGNDHRFTCLRHPQNRGTFAARLTGARSARGRYLSFVDSDDFVETDFLETLLSFAENSNADIVECAFYLHDESAETTISRRGPPETLDGEEVLNSLLHGYLFNALWNKLIKRSTWIDAMHRFEHNPIHLCFAEDLLCTFHLIQSANRYRRLDTPLYHYHLKEDPEDERQLRQRLDDLDTAFHLMEPQGKKVFDDTDRANAFLTREFVLPARNLLAKVQNPEYPTWNPEGAFETWSALENIWAKANTL